MSDESSIFELVTLPGVRRDGTEFDDSYHIDARWVRWQRKRPRKMGGYRALSSLVSGPVRATHVDARGGFVRAHLCSEFAIEQLTFNNQGFGAGLVDRTPVDFASNPLYTWQCASMYQSSGEAAPQIICAASPDLLALDSDDTGPIYAGSITSAGALSPVSDATGQLRVSGGCTVLQPFLFVYGSDGLIKNSNINDFSAATGWTTGGASAANTVNVAGTKIVCGLPLRGGGNSPSGLFWSLDSTIRVSYIGGTALWGYDTISSQTTVLSKNGFVEHDGLYYWVGVDRFFFYNGIVRELPNEMNINWFFDNINWAHRNKVWAMKVPRFGEIWWLFPFGESTECNAAVIYNIREQAWYDAMLLRSSGMAAGTYAYPVMAGEEDATETTRLEFTLTSGAFRVGDTVTGTTSGATGVIKRVIANALNLVNVVGEFENAETVSNGTGSAVLKSSPEAQQLDVVWQHEYGYDKIVGQQVLAIDSYYETRNFSLMDGGPTQDGNSGENKQVRLSRVEPDFVLEGAMALTVRGRAFPNSPKVDSEAFDFTADTLFITTREQRRAMSLKFSCNALGSTFQAGKILITISPGDERG